MEFFKYDNYEEALQDMQVIDAALGYPKLNESYAGTPPHTPNITEHYSFIKAHPDGELWAIPADQQTKAIIDKSATELTTDWYQLL